MNFITAIMVFVAYTKMGYYTLGQWHFAIRSYFKELKHLKGEVLAVRSRFGFPLGTMMVSVGQGDLPIDRMFPEEMARLRCFPTFKYSHTINLYEKWKQM